MTLPTEHRNKKVVYKSEKMFQTLKERGYLFSQDKTAEKIAECLNAIKDSQVGIFLEDKRQGVQSTYVCCFVTGAGHFVALPCSINEDHIHWYTVKDVKKDQNNPNWFVKGYNEVARTRGMDTLPLILKDS